MIPQELQILHDNLMQAQYPEDVFGETASQADVSRTFRQMARVVHPDRYNGDVEARDLAGVAFQKLNEFHEQAETQFEAGTWGQRKRSEPEVEEFDFEIKTKKRAYHLRRVLCEGDLSTVYGGDFEDDGLQKPVVAKIIDDARDNDLAQNEIQVLRNLRAGMDDGYDFGKHLPVFLAQFKTTEDQVGSLWEQVDGFDGYAIRERYPRGVPPEHAVWMLNRILLVLGYAHYQGILHGNIDPSHVMFRPGDHNGWLIDWSYAITRPKETGEGFRVLNADFSAPEVKAKGTPLPASDLYSVGKTMVYLMGGDVQTGTLPETVDKRLQRFIGYFLLESPRGRANDAWEVKEMLKDVRRKVFGPDRFREFKM